MDIYITERDKKIISGCEVKFDGRTDLRNKLSGRERLAVVIPDEAKQDSTWLILEKVHAVFHQGVVAEKIYKAHSSHIEVQIGVRTLPDDYSKGNYHIDDEARWLLRDRYGTTQINQITRITEDLSGIKFPTQEEIAIFFRHASPLPRLPARK
jgi:hypothetical protein